MKRNHNHQLFVTIVKKNQASKLVKAAKEAGAEGATILYARGSGIHENKEFLGIPMENEKELILTVAKQRIMKNIVEAVVRAGSLNQSGKGIGFIISLPHITGISHLKKEIDETDDDFKMEGVDFMAEEHIPFELIVTIVNKGEADLVLDSSMEAGAEGGTVINGRGSGIHEKATFFNIPIEPGKDVVLTLIHQKRREKVLKAIETGVGLNESGKGIAFVIDVERVVGINHVIDELKDGKKK
ncbi:P-II family nitrogen regulator [Bacillus sp. FJAT-45037]|uniref:P-II family nitrogen regulator n=1 Tax=Bacillus sp. FJAT-45037 TaxID=2011007 RepID=UPI001E40B924|nr:P-II family nitrogen regulator [Bacillus sp. FJAT-45037]